MNDHLNLGQTTRVALVLSLGIVLALSNGCGKKQRGPVGGAFYDTATQVSLMEQLSKGAFDGQQACSNLVQYGNVGLGTFAGLDGEMIVVSSQVYRVDADGKAALANPDMTTPFATVTFFEPDVVFDVGPLTQTIFLKTMDWKRPAGNQVQALRITGRFNFVKVRSVPKQAKPYPALADALKQQKEYELKDVAGTIIGFWYPDYLGNINASGYHMHFIDEARQAGGHVLDFDLLQGRIELDATSSLQVLLPVVETASATNVAGP